MAVLIYFVLNLAAFLRGSMVEWEKHPLWSLFLDLSPGSTTCWVALEKLHNLSELRFPIVNGNNKAVGCRGDYMW